MRPDRMSLFVTPSLRSQQGTENLSVPPHMKFTFCLDPYLKGRCMNNLIATP